jgi:hypothetical protein
LPVALFETLFEKIVHKCIEAGIVAGKSQAIDGAFVEANASLDKLELKSVMQWKLLQGEPTEGDASTSISQVSPFSLVEKTAKPRKPDRSNTLYQSKIDPQARLAQKAGKPFGLYYLSTMAVDTYHHVITHIQADYADERDSVHLLDLVKKVTIRLKAHGLVVKNVLADGGFGSGLNYSLLESYRLTAYIPLQGSYHPVREGFIYDAKKDVYLCRQGKQLINQGIKIQKGFANATYLAKQSECRTCPLKKTCCGCRSRKKLVVTAYRNHYQRMQERLESRKGKQMKKRRMATVEPVFGSLINYFGMKRANARGKQSAHKLMLMAACAYNRQKLLNDLKHLKPKAQVIVLQHGNILYFVYLCVVPQPRRFFAAVFQVFNVKEIASWERLYIVIKSINQLPKLNSLFHPI